MKRILGLMGLGAALLVTSCGDDEKGATGGTPPPGGDGSAGGVSPHADTVEKLGAEFIRQLEQLGQALRGVKDVASAQKVAEIAPLACAEFRDIAKRLTDLEPPSEEVKAAISKKIEEREDELARSLGGQEDFLNTLDPATQEIVKKAMGEFIQTMEEIQPVVEKYLVVKKEETVPPPPAPPESGAPGEAPSGEAEPVPVPDPEDPPTPAPAPEDPPAPAPEE